MQNYKNYQTGSFLLLVEMCRKAPSFIGGGAPRCCRPLVNNLAICMKIKNRVSLHFRIQAVEKPDMYVNIRVFTAALFYKHRMVKPLKTHCPSVGQCLQKLWEPHSVEYYSVFGRNV